MYAIGTRLEIRGIFEIAKVALTLPHPTSGEGLPFPSLDRCGKQRRGMSVGPHSEEDEIEATVLVALQAEEFPKDIGIFGCSITRMPGFAANSVHML